MPFSPSLWACFPTKPNLCQIGRESGSILISKLPQNPPLTVKLNQAISAHAFAQWNIPRERFHAPPSLPDAHPSVLDALNLDHPKQEYWRAIALPEWLKQGELFIESASQHRQDNLSLGPKAGLRLEPGRFDGADKLLFEGLEYAQCGIVSPTA